MGRDLLLFGLTLIVLTMFITLGAVVGVFTVTEEMGIGVEEPSAAPAGAEAMDRLAADLRGCLPLDHASQRFEARDGTLAFRAITAAGDRPGLYRVEYRYDPAARTLTRRIDEAGARELLCRDVLAFAAEAAGGEVRVTMSVLQEDGTRAELTVCHRIAE